MTASVLDRNWTDTSWMQDRGVSSVVESVLPQTNKEWARHSLLYFVLTYLSTAATNEFAEVHYELAHHLQKPVVTNNPQHLLALFPREHAKTTIVTFAYTLWCICYRIKSNIIICSDSKIQAKEFLRNVKTELETNEKIAEDFGDLVPQTGKKGVLRGKWDEHHIITANQVQVKLISPGTQTRGLQFLVTEQHEDTGKLFTRVQRPDLIILDDILNDKWIKNKIQRDKLEDWFFGPVFNAADSETGQLVVIGTVLHHDDLLTRLWKDDERTREWTKMKRPACEFKDGRVVNPLWEDRWPAAKLERRRVQIGSLAFAREFLLEPVDEASQYFHHSWFRFYITADIPAPWIPELMENGYEALPRDMVCVTAIDPAISKRDTADYSCIVTVGFSPTQRKYYVLDMFRQRCSPEAQVREMIHQCRKWDKTNREDGQGVVHLGFVIETYAYQESIKYWLKKFLDNEQLENQYKLYTRAEHGVDKQLRISGMSPMVEQNRLLFPIAPKRDVVTGQYHAVMPYQVMQDEFDQFPHGANDDTVDAVQRAYSVLIKQEKLYAYSGVYGEHAAAGFDALERSHGFMADYFNPPSA